MTRVLLPTPDYPPKRGGVARYLSALVKTFPERIEVDYVKGDLPTWGWMMRLLRRRAAYDLLLISHVLPIGTAAWLAGVYTRKPYAVVLHGMDFDLARRTAWKRFLTRQILRGAKAVVTNTEALAGEVRAFAAINVIVAHPCLTDELIEGEQVVTREPHEGIVLLTVGRLVERKGHEKVLRAMVDLPNVRYRIVGNGQEKDRLKSIVTNLGLVDRVEFIDDVPDGRLPSIYAGADIFVMPTTKSETDREGFGIVYLEAQAFGVPVVATRQPGVDEAVKDGEGGLLIDDTPEALHAALKKLIDNPALRERLGAAGRARVNAEFTREKQMSKFAQML